jgi:vacuolar-type H+-ATPase subunit E/Vma4
MAEKIDVAFQAALDRLKRQEAALDNIRSRVRKILDRALFHRPTEARVKELMERIQAALDLGNRAANSVVTR